ncbi:hypothetical protein IWW48_005633 [Coemansia sp. RSA 1200]|nr:hypothetical protein IWW48_005633 [Coemansia sp. RSA 1200]
MERQYCILYTREVGETFEEDYMVLIYHDTEYLEMAEDDTGLQVAEIVRMSGLENIIEDFTEVRTNHAYFFVLHGDVCDVYIPNRSFTDKRFHNEESAEKAQFYRFTYHREIYSRAVQEHTYEWYGNMKDNLDDIDKSSFSVVATIDGIDILSERKWCCSSDRMPCPEYHPLF